MLIINYQLSIVNWEFCGCGYFYGKSLWKKPWLTWK